LILNQRLKKSNCFILKKIKLNQNYIQGDQIRNKHCYVTLT